MASHSHFTAEEWPPIFDCKKLAQILGVSMSKARQIMMREDFKVVVISPRRHRIRREDLQEWLARQTS